MPLILPLPPSKPCYHSKPSKLERRGQTKKDDEWVGLVGSFCIFYLRCRSNAIIIAMQRAKKY